MKPTGFFILIFGLLFSLPAGAEVMYRNFIWGVKAQDVREFERAAFYKEEGGSLYFIEDKADRRTNIRYDFYEGKLWRVRFDYFELSEPDPQEILNLIMAEQQELTKLYGKPTSEELLWKKKKYRDHPKFWFRAFGGRDLTIRNEWKDDNTLVAMESFRNRDDQFYTLGYTIEDVEVAAKLEAAKMKLDWKTP